MLSIITLVLGFAAPFLTELFKMYNQKKDREHELAVMDRQMEQQAKGHSYRMEEINVEADTRESEALYKHAAPINSGVAWADAIISLYNSSVRPTLTYGFFSLYAIVKYSLVKTSVGVAWHVALTNTWSESDMAIFSGIIGFWFGQRHLMKYLNGRK